jgi:hypothetical protein
MRVCARTVYSSVTAISDPQSLVKEEPTPAVVTVPMPQIEQLPDPWKLDEPQQVSTETSSVVLQFTGLKLLPPAKEVKQKSKRNSTSEKTTSSAKAKSTTTPRKRGRPCKDAA